MSLKLAVWDIDGTIVDSREIIQTAMSEAFVKWGFEPPTYDQTRKIVGLSLEKAIATLMPEAEADLLANLTADYKNVFIARRTRPGYHEPLYEGAMELLEELLADGWLMGVATGKSRRGLTTVMDMHGMERFFDSHWCADDGPGKPHPFMVEQNMRELGCDPHQTVMIGDATFDMQMARSANVHAIGVSWGFGAAEEIEAAGADEVHHTFDTLRTSLKGFGERTQA